MRRALKAVGLCLVIFMGYFLYSLATGKERVTELCGQIKPGTTIEELRKFAEDKGFNPPSRNLNANSPRTYLAETRSMGRHICEVELANGVVNATRYQSNL